MPLARALIAAKRSSSGNIRDGFQRFQMVFSIDLEVFRGWDSLGLEFHFLYSVFSSGIGYGVLSGRNRYRSHHMEKGATTKNQLGKPRKKSALRNSNVGSIAEIASIASATRMMVVTE